MSRKGQYYNLVLAQTLDKTIDEKVAKKWYVYRLKLIKLNLVRYEKKNMILKFL